MLGQLLKEQKQERIDLLFKHARELMEMITDEELAYIYSKYPEIFSELSRETEYKEECISEAIAVFTEYLQNKGLSKDEFEVMTFDDIMEYVSDILRDMTNQSLYELIKELENDRRNS